MSPRLFYVTCCPVIFLLLEARAPGQVPQSPVAKEDKALAAGQVSLELELLSAPMALAADAIYAGRGDSASDTALREKLLASGASTVVRASTRGAAGAQLEENKLKATTEPLIYVYSSKWQEQGSDMKEGKAPSPLTLDDYDTSSETHETGHLLLVKAAPVAGGIETEINFRWMGTPVIRPVDSWPVKGAAPHITQDRQWETNTRHLLLAGKTTLLAAAPEPADGEGKPAGHILLAFVRASAGPAAKPVKEKPVEPGGDADTPLPYTNRVIQLWTFELPSKAAREWIATRRNAADDEKQFLRLLRPSSPTGVADAPALISMEVLCDVEGGAGDAFVSSALQWLEPRGFEPADTRWVKFVPVPNESRTRSITHRLLTENVGQGILTLPVGALKRTRWYGSTRGVLDEPVGVETFLTGDSAGSFFPGGRTGVVRLVAAQPHEDRMRLSFVRVFGADGGGVPRNECTFSLVETAPDPWMSRLTAGADPTQMIPEVQAAVDHGNALVLHDEFVTWGGWRWTREASRPWLSFVNYLNPSIHDGKFCFNPRFVYPEVPAGIFDMGDDGTGLTFCGRPSDQQLGLWLTNQPDYSAANSGIPVTEWPQITVGFSSLPAGRQIVGSVSLGRAWKSPAQRALHWLIVQKERDPNGSEQAADLAPLAMTTFTLQGADGSVLEHVSIAGRPRTYADGRLLHTIQPEKLYGTYDFKEKPASKPGEPLGSPSIVATLDGITLLLEEKGWSLTRTTEPVKKVTESVLGYTEQPAGNDYAPSVPVPVSCERLVLGRETLSGAWPAAGADLTKELDGGRKLFVRKR